MRDPGRIEEMMSLLNSIWGRNPDLRFNQLIYILQSEYSHRHDGVGQVKEIEVDGFTRIGFDLFNLEDENFMDYLREMASADRGSEHG